MRKTLILIHRWLALIVGAVLLATAVSGAALVFEGAIDRVLNPSLWRVTPGAVTLPLDTLVARVEAAIPGGHVASLSMTTAPDQAWTMGVGPLTVFVDPYTGRVNGTRTPAQSQTTFARRLHVFHVELVAGPVGRSIVGAATAVALFLVVTGIILWWPDKLIRIRRNASWKRINFDLHHVLGIAASLILIVITSSGLLIHYDALANLVKSLGAAPTPHIEPQPPGPADAPRLSFDSVVAVAHRTLPGATVRNLSMGSATNPVAIGMRFPDDRTPGGRSRVFLNRHTGEVLGVVSTHDARFGVRIDNLKRSLHTGDVLGKPTEALWMLASLVMAAQVLTGVLMWWNARRGRRRV